MPRRTRLTPPAEKRPKYKVIVVNESVAKTVFKLVKGDIRRIEVISETEVKITEVEIENK